MTDRSTPETTNTNAPKQTGAINGNITGGMAGGGKGESGVEASIQGLARGLKGDVTHMASDLAGEAKHVAEEKLDAGKDFATEQLMSVADALRKASKELEASDSVAAPYVQKAATSVEAVSDYFLTKTISELVNDVEGYARREPAVFLGGAFFVGMLGGRFLKAASPAGGNQSGAARSSMPSKGMPRMNASSQSQGQGQGKSRPQGQQTQGQQAQNQQSHGQQGQDRNQSGSQAQGQDRNQSGSQAQGQDRNQSQATKKNDGPTGGSTGSNKGSGVS